MFRIQPETVQLCRVDTLSSRARTNCSLHARIRVMHLNVYVANRCVSVNVCRGTAGMCACVCGACVRVCVSVGL